MWYAHAKHKNKIKPLQLLSSDFFSTICKNRYEAQGGWRRTINQSELRRMKAFNLMLYAGLVLLLINGSADGKENNIVIYGKWKEFVFMGGV